MIEKNAILSPFMTQLFSRNLGNYFDKNTGGTAPPLKGFVFLIRFWLTRPVEMLTSRYSATKGCG